MREKLANLSTLEKINQLNASYRNSLFDLRKSGDLLEALQQIRS